jgi:hypothetical protein
MALVLISIFLVGAESAAVCLDPPSGMVSWWPGDGDASDIIGPNEGNLQNGTAFAPGKVDQAFSFDGVDDVVGASGTGIDDLQQLTIDAWVMHNSLPPGQNMRYVTLQNEKAVLRYEGAAGPGRLHFYMRIDGVNRSIRVNNVLQIGVFQHVAGTYDGSAMRLYLDGAEIGTLMAGGTVDTGDGVVLGAGPTLDGLLDEVEIYDRALSASEIQAIYDAGSEGKCKPAGKYYISWGYVGHQVYEDGGELNRLSFELIDENTDLPPPVNIVDAVTLTDPNSGTVPLSNLAYWTDSYLFGSYNGDTGQWNYPEEFTFWPGHGAEIDAPLIVGTYHLAITDIYGDTHHTDLEFSGSVNLPIISSSSFQIRLDPHNNLIWEWDVNDCYYLDPSLETQVRAYIQILDQNGDDSSYYAWMRLPTHLGRLFVPSDVLRKIYLAGKSWRFRIQLRTTDNNSRAYSNYLAYEIDLACKCDLNQDGSCNGQDWLLFFPDWGRTDCNEPETEACDCDLNEDGSCDGADWLMFFPDWGREDCPVRP